MLEKAELNCREDNVDLSTVETHLVLNDRAISLLRELTVSVQDDFETIDANDLEHIKSLPVVFAEMEQPICVPRKSMDYFILKKMRKTVQYNMDIVYFFHPSKRLKSK